MGSDNKALRITSPAFEHLERIPRRHAHEAEDVSPALEWSGVPDGTRQLALICHDPDAPRPHGFTHWVLYDIPPDVTGVGEGDGGRFAEGPNDFGEQGWGGPLPPEGHGPHHYYFWVYALDAELDLEPGLDRAGLLDRIENHIIEQARLVGSYER